MQEGDAIRLHVRFTTRDQGKVNKNFQLLGSWRIDQLRHKFPSLKIHTQAQN